MASSAELRAVNLKLFGSRILDIVYAMTIRAYRDIGVILVD
jgi:hypothetical protein